ncbi:MAG TPA: anthranilate phosphoribosyltransferase [Steroidobacteraceae bacterium]|nr:anthranilate phosphoribosyltransferase [Steroidobacteraceae bacterium]
MAELRKTLDHLLEHRNLSEADASQLLLELTNENLAPAMAGALLAALRSKGLTADELRGFAKAMRKLAKHPVISPGAPLVDIVGTGGDSSGSFNLSTGAGLLIAALGLRVVKHGNRAVSSRSGSADTLEQLGLKLPLSEAQAGQCLDATGFTFLFAPYYHSATKAVAPIRQALGVRTVFNILGPLCNPAEPPFHLMGAFNLETAKLMADTLAGLPNERAYVVHGEPGWDEATPCGAFECFEVHNGHVKHRTRSAAEFGLPGCTPQELQGGDAAYNAQCLRDVFSGKDQGAHRHALILNAALVLELTGRATSPVDAAQQAAAAIDSGRATEVLVKLSAFGAHQ